jgi:hypothetical protein
MTFTLKNVKKLEKQKRQTIVSIVGGGGMAISVF